MPKKVCGILLSLLVWFALAARPVQAWRWTTAFRVNELYSSPAAAWWSVFWKRVVEERRWVIKPIPSLSPTPFRATPQPTPTPWVEPTSTPIPSTPPTPSPRPTILPTAKPSATPLATAIPQPSLAPEPTAAPSPLPTASPQPTAVPTSEPARSGEVLEQLIQQINDYRKSQGLPLVQTDPYTCGFAATRAREIESEFNHNGFRNRIDAKTLPYSSYHVVTENIARTARVEEVVQLWINSAPHAAAMREDTPFVCVGINGDYYAYEGWKP